MYASIDKTLLGGTWDHDIKLGAYDGDRRFANINGVGTLELYFEVWGECNCDEIEISYDVNYFETKYYNVETHLHTRASDGQYDSYQIANKMREFGKQAAFITDHNSICGLYMTDAPTSIPLYKGIEITTRNGHFNLLGIKDIEAFRLDTIDDINQIAEKAQQQGALFSVNHPYDITCNSCYLKWDFNELKNVDTLEIWNDGWFNVYQGKEMSFNEQSLELWHKLLCDRKKIFAIAGSDYHGPSDVKIKNKRKAAFYPDFHVYAQNLELENVLKAVKNGNSYITKMDEPITFASSVKFGEYFDENTQI